MGCLRILKDNYTDTDVVATATVSSADTDYPISNIYDVYRRTKMWRSDGYWDLSAGTPSIVFQETIGVDLTATLADTEYTSDTTLFAAIKTALEASGDSTYTVSRDTSTNKIKIASNGGGGGGVFRLKFATSTFMAGILGYDTVDLTGALTYTADELKIHTSEWIKWDFGMPSNPKAFIFTGNRNKALNISPNATIKLQGNSTDAWGSPAYDQSLTYDDFVLWLHNSDGLHTVGLRYWRFYVVDSANPLGYIEGGLVYLGDSYSFDRGAIQFGFSVEFIDRSTTIFSEGGQEFTDERPKSDRFQFTIGALTSEDVEDLYEIFQEVGTHKPFFLSFDTSSVFSSSANKWVRYCKFESPPTRTLQSMDLWNVSVSLREVL